MHQPSIVLAAIVVMAITLVPAITGCGGGGLERYVPDKRLDYKKQREAGENLEVPPDLTVGAFDDALDVPGGAATYSEFMDERQTRKAIATSGDILPEVENVKMVREGTSRWLEIEDTPKRIWPRVIAFWREQGILLVDQDPVAGVMKTDWLENRAEIRRDFLTNTIRRVAPGLYATSTRDQYRVRIEPGLEQRTTDLYLTHRGMEERVVESSPNTVESTIWEPSGTDPDKEAAMLRRLMVYLGVTEERANRMLADEQTRASRSRLEQDGGVLVIGEEYRRAWRLTGLALDRVGFAVQDRDRTQGIYFVRYDDPDRGPEKKKGFGSKIAFWRSDDKPDTDTEYQVKLSSEGDETRVVVRDQAGRIDDSETARRILALLNEQIQ